VAVGLLINPGADGSEHIAVDFELLIAKGWVMEDAEDIGHNFLNGNPWVLPSVQNTSIRC
jgi:hypothetical protein